MQTINRGSAGGRWSRQYYRGSHSQRRLSALFLTGALVFAAPLPVFPQALLQVQVIDGDGEAHSPGSRLSRPLVVKVTDETGTAVAGATLSFRLPDDGAGGVFANGLRTEIATTDAQGRAAIHGLQFNRTPGQFEIRITAARGQSRAGTISTQIIGGTPVAGGGKITRALTTPPATSHRKWILAGLAVAGAAGAGLALRGGGGSAMRAPGLASALTQPPPVAPAVSIGAPVIVIGKP